MSVKEFCYSSSYRVMRGLKQELDLKPGISYQPIGHNAARVMSLKLAGINPHYLPKVLTMRDQLTMWAGLDDKSKVRIGWVGTNILIEIPKPPPYWKQVTLETLAQRRMIRRGLIATLGLGLQDDPKRIDFKEAAMAHVLISGQTRSGKTNTQKLIGWNIAHNTDPQDAQLIIFDVAKRGYKWQDFNNIPHLAHPVITDVTEAEQVLAWLSSEIERRATGRFVKPRIFCLVDELKALTDDSKLAAAYLARVASVGGEFGLHLILATQYPQVKMLGNSELKRNVTTRLCGKVDDANAAANALGMAGTGAESLQGYGDFLLKDFDGLSRLTVAKIEDRHIAQLPRTEPKRLDLPNQSQVNDGPPRRQTDSLEPEHLAIAVFEPMGINKLQKRLGIGGNKATRIKMYADAIRASALRQGYDCLEPSE